MPAVIDCPLRLPSSLGGVLERVFDLNYRPIFVTYKYYTCVLNADSSDLPFPHPKVTNSR